ncbi:putative short chain dehydrogenase protein [Echria macrotheca]|uniref:Short chain dehydrogenase protein n=1 Tax=Echria macrotheca TaxID=438768 RepID=A0AAJ0BIY7_9PEZI|nr:putative short chain dehydrogenase protein [Echria macrotheca]
MAHSTIFTYLGILFSLGIVAATIDFILPYLRPSRLHRYLHRGDSAQTSWALVTGASDGIGKALCYELAATGFNVVLHGRNPSKLEAVQNSLSSTFPSRAFRTIVADATICTEDAIQAIANRVSDLQLTVVINNAGGTPVSAPNGDIYKRLDEYSHKEVADTVNMNVVFPTMLSNALLPLMIRNGGRGVIIMIGSVAARGFPLIAPYGAGKAYLRVLSEALGQEMHMAGYDVEVICMPLGGVTGVQAIWQKPSLFTPHATTAAKKILARVGCGRSEIMPHWPHALQRLLTDLIPRGLRGGIFREAMAEIQRNGLNPQDGKRD